VTIAGADFDELADRRREASEIDWSGAYWDDDGATLFIRKYSANVSLPSIWRAKGMASNNDALAKDVSTALEGA
jgi:hypothetical protein